MNGNIYTRVYVRINDKNEECKYNEKNLYLYMIRFSLSLSLSLSSIDSTSLTLLYFA